MILDCPNHFGWVQIVLDMSKLFCTGRDAAKAGEGGGGGAVVLWWVKRFEHVQKLHEGQGISDVGDSTHAIKRSLR